MILTTRGEIPIETVELDHRIVLAGCPYKITEVTSAKNMRWLSVLLHNKSRLDILGTHEVMTTNGFMLARDLSAGVQVATLEGEILLPTGPGETANLDVAGLHWQEVKRVAERGGWRERMFYGLRVEKVRAFIASGMLVADGS